MSSSKPGMGFDVEGAKKSDKRGREKDSPNNSEASEQQNAASNEEPSLPRVSQQGAPVCVKHNCVMHSTSSAPDVTYYKCQVPGCGESGQVSRARPHFFAKPMFCPIALCRTDEHGNDRESAALEINKELSRSLQITMSCPRCSYQISVPNPAMRMAHHNNKKIIPDLGER